MSLERSGVCVVTTVADARNNIDYFIQYHQNLGFDHIYIFIDDQCKETYKRASSYPFTTAIIVDDDLAEDWKHVPFYRDRKKRDLLGKEVMVRQEFNVFVAAERAKIAGFRWMLHLDIDELFFPNGHNIKEFFSKSEESGVGAHIHLNYEAIPEDNSCTSIYESSSNFKRNFFRKGQWTFTPAQRNLLKTLELPEKFFNYYQNGKPSFSLIDQTIVDDVHSIRPASHRVEFLEHKHPIILHFPCMSIDEFRKKYMRLGFFPTEWKGMPRAGKFIDTLHLEARDLFHSDPRAFDQIFYDRIKLAPNVVNQLKRKNLVQEIKLPAFKLRPANIEPDVLDAIDLKPSPLVVPTISTYTELDLHRGDTPLINSINFDTLAEARRWVRRHPLYQSEKTVQIRQREACFTVFIRQKPLLDTSQDQTIELLAKMLSDQIQASSTNYLVVNDLGRLANSSIKNITLYADRSEKISALFDALRLLPDELSQRIILSPGAEHETYAVICGFKQLGDVKLVQMLHQSLIEKNHTPFTNYVTGRFPRSEKHCWFSLHPITANRHFKFLTNILQELETPVSLTNRAVCNETHSTHVCEAYQDIFIESISGLLAMTKLYKAHIQVTLINMMHHSKEFIWNHYLSRKIEHHLWFNGGIKIDTTKKNTIEPYSLISIYANVG